MIIKGQSIAAAVDRPDPGRRFYLFHGPDDAGSRALAARLLSALGAEKFAVSASTIREDPASLADEAGAMALFGGPRAIWIEPAGDEITDGVAALLEASVTESAVIAIAGSLRKTSSLLKLAEAHQAAAACASYAPEGRNASKMVVAMGRDEGLVIDLSVAERIADEADGNRAVAANELAKYALYLDASREQPKPLSHEVVDLLGCGSGDGNVQRLGDLALDGDVASLIDEMDRAGIAASEAVSVMRALQRRLMGIVPLSARAAGGESLSGVMASAGRSIFWKEKDFVERMLRIWPAERLARLIERTAEVEQALMLSDVPEVASVGEHLIAIGRVAERRR